MLHVNESARHAPARAPSTVPSGRSVESLPSRFKLEREIVALASRPGPRLDKVPSLQAMAASVYLGPMQSPADLGRMASAIEKVPHGLRRDLLRTAGGKLRKVTARESDSLAMMVAETRVRNGEPCDKVARRHKIDCSLARDELEVVAANGPAKARVLRGEPCYAVTRDHGIRSSKLWLMLEMMAIDGPAGARVMHGESYRTVASEHGIYTAAAVARLQRLAEFGFEASSVRRPAGSALRRH